MRTQACHVPHGSRRAAVHGTSGCRAVRCRTHAPLWTCRPARGARRAAPRRRGAPATCGKGKYAEYCNMKYFPSDRYTTVNLARRAASRRGGRASGRGEHTGVSNACATWQRGTWHGSLGLNAHRGKLSSSHKHNALPYTTTAQLPVDFGAQYFILIPLVVNLTWNMRGKLRSRNTSASASTPQIKNNTVYKKIKQRNIIYYIILYLLTWNMRGKLRSRNTSASASRSVCCISSSSSSLGGQAGCVY